MAKISEEFELMGRTYQKDRFVDNVYFLARQKRLKIGELESACGVSVGYLARLRQEQKNVAPGADFLLAIATKLSVPMDLLLLFDFSTVEADSDVISFIGKLVRETQSRRLLWQQDILAPRGYLPLETIRTNPHPLYVSSRGRTESIVLVAYYRSMAHPELLGLIVPAAYKCAFPGGRTLYLVQIENRSKDSPAWSELELVMTGPDLSDPVLLAHINHEQRAQLDDVLKFLLSTIQNILALPLMSREAREIIHDYLQEVNDESEENESDRPSRRKGKRG